MNKSDIKAFLEYVYRLERIGEGEGYDKKYTDKVGNVFDALRRDAA